MSVEKIIKPSIYASELRERLLLDGVVDADDWTGPVITGSFEKRAPEHLEQNILIRPSRLKYPDQNVQILRDKKCKQKITLPP